VLNSKLKALAERVHDKKLREKILELLKNPTIEINGKKYSGIPLEDSAAGRSHHHCYPGGYVEHVVSTATIALAMCDSVENVYHGKVNRDLVLAGVLLHDIFKPITYAVNKSGGYSSTRLADYMDHLSLAIAELIRRDFPLEVVHIISAHHGEYGPIRPHTIEALICHLADLMDSRFNGEVLSAARYLARRVVGEELFWLNSKEAFEIILSKSLEDWEGVAKTVEKIKQRKKLHKA